MTHSEFLEAYHAREVKIHINRSEALHLVKTKLFDRYTATAFLILTWISVLLFPAAIALFIWFKLLSIFVLIIAFMLPNAIRTSAAQSVRDKILKDEVAYYNLTRSKIVVVEPV